jgi:hypothetical protein
MLLDERRPGFGQLPLLPMRVINARDATGIARRRELALRDGGPAVPGCHPVLRHDFGGMFWLNRKRFPGSYSPLTF